MNLKNKYLDKHFSATGLTKYLFYASILAGIGPVSSYAQQNYVSKVWVADRGNGTYKIRLSTRIIPIRMLSVLAMIFIWFLPVLRIFQGYLSCILKTWSTGP
ncbi:hypothetical protein [Arachidicoccus ginsenosidivorans]|uniref:hypothetical protein n=1 Tax=Arachidicoccus ginsenosidivorans TaxID=496057 RepID=UPI001CEFB0A4|nr:hypothetical protein [Arachidicoccus ginsenosidivorans]